MQHYNANIMALDRPVEPKVNLVEWAMPTHLYLKLLSISDRFVRNIDRELTYKFTTYMIPFPAKNIEETHNSIAVYIKYFYN